MVGTMTFSVVKVCRLIYVGVITAFFSDEVDVVCMLHLRNSESVNVYRIIDFFATVPFMSVYCPCYDGTFWLIVSIKTFERC